MAPPLRDYGTTLPTQTDSTYQYVGPGKIVDYKPQKLSEVEKIRQTLYKFFNDPTIDREFKEPLMEGMAYNLGKNDGKLKKQMDAVIMKKIGGPYDSVSIAYADSYKIAREKVGGKTRTLRKIKRRKIRGSGALFSTQKPTYPGELARGSAEQARDLGENHGKRDKSLDEEDMEDDRTSSGEHAPQSAYRYTNFLRLPTPSNENEKQYRDGYRDGYEGVVRIRPAPAEAQAIDEDPKNVDNGGRKHRRTRRHTKKSRRHKK